MGVVFEALQESLGRRVALKVVRPENLVFGSSVDRFRREGAAAALMRHPGIVPVYTFGEDAGLPYFTMELIDGCTLAEVLESLSGQRPKELNGDDLTRSVHAVRGMDGERADVWNGRPWVEVCLEIARRVADALEHAHRRGVIHRDVKPSNIAITRDGRTMLLDFGLAAVVGETQLTKSGVVPGSLLYVSPERLNGERNVDPRTDIYSLGVTLYEMLALHTPYTSASTEFTMQRILAGAPPRLRETNPLVRRDVEVVCMKAMDIDLRRRYQTAAEFALDLSNLSNGRPVQARPPTLSARALRWGRRHPRSTWAAALISIVAILAAGSELWRHRIEVAIVAERVERARALAEEGELDGALAETEQALGLRPKDVAALTLRTELHKRADRRARLSAAQIGRLSDVKILRDLIRKEPELWPAFPSRIGYMSAWLARARGVLESEDIYRGALETLAVDHTTELVEDTETEWQREILTELVEGLRELPDIVGHVTERITLAQRTAILSTEGPEARQKWIEASTSIAELSVYGGLALAPQMGLLPLWRNPQSGLWEFLVVRTGEAPERDAQTGRSTVAEGTGIVLVLVPAGSFAMGSYPVSAEHPRGSPNADPEHRTTDPTVRTVALGAYFLSKYEMTQGQWLRVTESSANFPDRAESDDHPMSFVSWRDANGTLACLGLSLPTEAQWEYATRAGSSTVFWTGDDVQSLVGAANIADEALGRHDPKEWFERGFEDGFIYKAPVGSLRPNAWGVHDVHGNLWEWCLETREPGQGFRTNASPSFAALATARGGSFLDSPSMMRAARRSSDNAGSREVNQGVRPARSIEPR
ncbi:MAG: SUMF1/EgtB/PvdO family nonheme iron enzyme [bacterium]|nr:SUMF1/EgtB/PvdO family nonheme iron enzyme [bacterium]